MRIQFHTSGLRR